MYNLYLFYMDHVVLHDSFPSMEECQLLKDTVIENLIARGKKGFDLQCIFVSR
tara:strand:+ start:74 stop:232 length:159 start_codon:yes stop_codon:yes gene_type:complete